MKFSSISALAALAGAASASAQQQEVRVTTSKMQALMDIKSSHRQTKVEMGMFDENRYESTSAATRCVNGRAGSYACNKVDMLSFKSHQDMGSRTREGNDIWGWTSSTGREFALVGQTDGTAFVEVYSDGTLGYLGRLPTQTSSSTWRDVKVIGDYAYIGSEASRHGIQIFDLKKLLTLSASSPTTFSTSRDLAAHYSGFSNSHNIVANPDTDMIYGVGTNQCRGGLFMLDVSTPSSPRSLGCYSSDGYTHDAQCVVYAGPHAAYRGREICFNYNEDTLTIVDVTDKSSPVQLSRTAYSGSAYTHQGWLADSSMSYLLLDDELDEMYGTVGDTHTHTYIVDVRDLTRPRFVGTYKSPAYSIDHNQYVKDGLAYQSNYGSGLRIVDVSSVTSDPSGSSFKEVGYFDSTPEDDNSVSVSFVGAWSVYPYFESGIIILNNIERGLFTLKYTG